MYGYVRAGDPWVTVEWAQNLQSAAAQPVTGDKWCGA
jgi:hypothetical protein